MVGNQWVGKLREFLLPGDAERDEKFRAEILKLSVRGLTVIGLIEIGGPLFTLLGRFVLRLTTEHAGPPIQGLSYIQTAGGVSIGVLTLLVARSEWGRARARLLGCISGWLIGAHLITTWLALARTYPVASHYLPNSLTIVLLVGIAALPLQPLHTLAVGVAIEAYSLTAWRGAVHWGIVQASDWDALMHLFSLMVILICTGLSALLYAERRAEHDAHQRALAVAEALSAAQGRVMLAESTASLGRLAAGLLHELNSPLGALSSAASTLMAVSAKLPAATPEQQVRLLALQDELSRSLLGSVQRLQRIVSRVWNLTNLEDADLLPTDLNEMLLGVASLYDERVRERSVKVELDFQPMPAVACRRQQLKAVFTVLLDNAAQAVSDQGWIKISTRRRNQEIEVKLADNGKGIPADQLRSIFSPGFTTRGERVEARNWGLFSARQMVRAHGGEIVIRSEPGSGTEVTITLPA